VDNPSKSKEIEVLVTSDAVHVIPSNEVLPKAAPSALDVVLEPGPSLSWVSESCCGGTFYKDPKTGKLHAVNGDSSSAVHDHKDDLTIG